MKKYAIVDIGGKQYKLVEGEELLLDKVGSKTINSKVLMVSDGEKVKVGQPYIKGVSVKLKIIEEEVKGEKIHVRKYKAKSRYRKKVGFRPKYSKIFVEKIS